MFKSSFAKYLTAFVIIILVSFLMLSGIITSMIRTHVVSDKEIKLQNSCQIITSYFKNDADKDIATHIQSEALYIQTLVQLVKEDYGFNVLVADKNGQVLLSTYSTTPDGMPNYSTNNPLGNISVKTDFDTELSDAGVTFYIYRGELKGIPDSNDRCVAYAQEIIIDGESCGYVLTLASMSKEDDLISVARKTVINSSIWVMLAAVIAAYFITERIVHPLKSMTRADRKSVV